MIAIIAVSTFALLLVLGMILAVKQRDGRVRLGRLFHFDGGLPAYWFRESKSIHWQLRSRPDLLVIGSAFLVLAIIVALPVLATIVRSLASP
jgi:hypothetical protein